MGNQKYNHTYYWSVGAQKHYFARLKTTASTNMETKKQQQKQRLILIPTVKKLKCWTIDPYESSLEVCDQVVVLVEDVAEPTQQQQVLLGLRLLNQLFESSQTCFK